MKKENILLYGGSFDPIHLGHEEVIKSVHKELNLNRIILVPNFQSPLKDKVFLTPSDRLLCIEQVLKRFPYIEISTYEIKKEAISYSYETVKFFKELYANSNIIFLIGADNWESRSKWKNFDFILRKSHVLIVGRPGVTIQHFNEYPYEPESFGEPGGITYFEGPMIDISSTQVKEIIIQDSNLSNVLHPDIISIVKNK